MKPRLIILFLLIVLLPLALLLWLGLRVSRFEQQETQRRFQQLLLNQLIDVDQDLTRFLESRRRRLLELTAIESPTPEVLREMQRRHSFVSQLLVLGREGKILYPNPQEKLTSAEKEFLERANTAMVSKDLMSQSELEMPAQVAQNQRGQREQRQQAVRNAPANQLKQRASRSAYQQTDVEDFDYKGEVKPQTSGWYVWYWDRATHLIFWQQQASGLIVGAELDHVRLLADIIALLPSTDTLAETPFTGRITLTNAMGDVLYQWGSYELTEQVKPLAVHQLSYPLSLWKLNYYLPDQEQAGHAASGRISLFTVLFAVVVVLGGLAVIFYRESTREIRQAAQRVSFVNQVSHELKTPLTNIRLYAELLEDRLPDTESKEHQHLSVIVSESHRLSRLIGNILNFSRKQRNKLVLRVVNGVVDEVIADVLENFKPSFDHNGFNVIFDAQADKKVAFDPDVVEQILGNLFNNVEKYAASGKSLWVQSTFDNDQTTIVVSDNGPGIAPRQREKIFQPFYRVSNKLTDGVSGTGIGLAIARDLARLHGGDLVMLDSKSGATFKITLRTVDQEK